MTGALAHVPGGAAGAGLVAAVALMTLVWAVSVVRRDVSVIDAWWGPAFVLLAWTWRALLHPGGARALLVCLLVTAWGVRLAVHIAWRNRGRGEDPRYAEMRARNPRTFAWTSLATVFALQAVLAWVIAMPVLAVQAAPPRPLGAVDGAGMLLWLVGFGFESVGDAQLASFKAAPGNRGRVMSRGLWAWTRHPNYFGEACLWWGIGLFALAARGGAWTLVGPALITFLLLKVSGVTLLERHMRERSAEYVEYVRRTSAFVPWPPRPAR